MTANYPFRVPVGEFKDKRVLVTGGTKRIGEAIVRRFTLGGALVATTARSPLQQDQSHFVFVHVLPLLRNDSPSVSSVPK